jgi:DNA-binding NarL/FixJ family response regulator
MNPAIQLAPSVSLHWFAENDQTFRQISQMAGATNQGAFEYHDKFQKTAALQISLLAPCQVVIVEIPSSDQDASLSLNAYRHFTSLLDESIRHGTFPTIICLGDRLPAQQVVEWMKLGVFTYVEKSSQPSNILKAINDAKQIASKTLDKYLRFQRLNEIWKTIEPDELLVMEMIFEGLPNKTIASRLKVSQRTVEARRHRVFEKFDSKSLPIVVRKICEWHQLKQEFCDVTFEVSHS